MVAKRAGSVTEESTLVTSEANTQNMGTTFLTVLLVISIALNAFSLYFLLGFSISYNDNTDQVGLSASVKNTLLELEYEKVGGKENFEVLQKYSQMQIGEQIGQIRQIVESGKAPQQPTTNNAATPQGTIDAEKVKAIVADASIEGNKNATILVVEYSDMECPFCMRQYHDTDLFPKLLAQYKDQVAVAFKNNRGVNHKGTEAKAIGALCAQKVGGDSGYQKFYKGIMDKSTNDGGVLEVSKLPEIAKLSGVDVRAWQKCYDNKDTLAQFTAQTNEARAYGLSGTPGTLILNVKTGKYATVEGAYPYETFTAQIDALLKE